MMVYHVNTHGTLCTTFDISATCQAMVFGDAGGNLCNEILKPLNGWLQACTEFSVRILQWLVLPKDSLETF